MLSLLRVIYHVPPYQFHLFIEFIICQLSILPNFNPYYLTYSNLTPSGSTQLVLQVFYLVIESFSNFALFYPIIAQKLSLYALTNFYCRK